MKNILKNRYFQCSLVLLALTSCMDDDQNYPAADKPFITTNAPDVTLLEGESSTFTIMLSRAIGDPTDVKIEQISGNASATDYDFSVATLDEAEIGPAGYQATIPATTTSVDVTVTAAKDVIPEGSETATFRLVQGQNGNGIIQGDVTFTVSINNEITNDLVFELAWDGPHNDDYELCDVDFDIFLNTFDAYAFTGNCPEVVTYPENPANLWTSELADGTYNIIVDLWDLNDVLADVEDPNFVLNIPLRLTIGKYGQVSGFIDLGDLYTTESLDTNNDGAGEMLAGSIIVTNGLYAIYDRDGELVVQEN